MDTQEIADIASRRLPDLPTENKTKGKLLWESFKKKCSTIGLLRRRQSVKLQSRSSLKQRHSVYWDDHHYSGSLPYGLYYHILEADSHIDGASVPIDQAYQFIRPSSDHLNQNSASSQSNRRRNGSVNRNLLHQVIPMRANPIQEDYAAPNADQEYSPESGRVLDHAFECNSPPLPVVHIKPLNETLFNLYKQGWYWGPISRAECENKLRYLPTGSFLVRDSSDDRYLLSLSFRIDNVTLHCRIEYSNGLFSLLAHGRDGCPTVEEFIEKTIEKTKKGEYCMLTMRTSVLNSRMIPVKLVTPVSRFMEVKSLQYLCRFVIRQHIRVDKIETLPVPENLKDWIAEQQF